MPSEREKMLAGALYDPLDSELVAGRERARDLCQALNATREGEADARRAILRELFGRGGDTAWMQPPFSATTGRTSSSASGCSSTSTASCSTSAACA
jgi:maltose O-acetyltransferase